MKKAVILARVSTLRQEKEGLSLQDIQLPILRDYAKDNDLEVVREFVFSESADRKIRTKFNEMIAYHQIDKKTGEIIAYWNSLGEIKRLLGYRPYHIQRVLHGEFKTFKGYNWKYI